MYKSYYYLNRLTIELRDLLSGKTIKSVFSQEKDHLIIEVNDLFIDISVDHGEPYINIKYKFARAKKNTINFFEELIGTEVTDVQIPSCDRIIKITAGVYEIYFAIRGKYTNVFIISKVDIQSFKSEDEEYLLRFKEEVSAKSFISKFNFIEDEAIKDKTISEIRKQFLFIGREIENEILCRKQNGKSDYENLKIFLKTLFTDKPAIFLESRSSEPVIAFESMQIFSSLEKIVFENLIDAFNFYLSKKHYSSQLHIKLKIVQSYLEKEMKKLSNRLNTLLILIENGSKESDYNKIANLLLINLNNIKPGVDEVLLDDIYLNENTITVKMDSKLSVQKNAAKYFEKAKDSKLNYEKSMQLYGISKTQFEKIRSYKVQLENINSLDEVNKIMKELKIKDQSSENKPDEISGKFKHYLLEDKYHVFVGKDSQNNDLLTTKFAKQNDFWFHARSVSGSHVILRVENTKEVIPKNILKKAASLAAYHSKAKTASLVPVSYTFKKYVVKRKGMPVGQVSLLKEDVLLVKPEIPVLCNYLTDG